MFNTVDSIPPSSQIEALPAEVATPFEVRWSGADTPADSGLYAYDIYLSADGGFYVPWILGSVNISAVLVGEPGVTYRFYSVARDHAGNIEAAPLQPDAWTTVTATPYLRIESRQGLLTLTIENLLLDQPYVIEGTPALLQSPWTTLLEFKAVDRVLTQPLEFPPGQTAFFIRLRQAND